MIIEYNEGMARELTDLFHEAVHDIDSSVYSESQKSAWAPTPINYKNWVNRLKTMRPLVCCIHEEIAGFIELEDNGHIDCFYVKPKFQNQGIGSKLYEFVLKRAKLERYPLLYTEASIIAFPFFKSKDFKTIGENVIVRNGESLINYSMELTL